MRRLLAPLVLLVPLAVPAPAPAAGQHCGHRFDHGERRLCHVVLPAHRSAVFVMDTDCYARRFYAIDASPDADASADGHFIAPHRVRMLNDQWSGHNRLGPLHVEVTYGSHRAMHYENLSRFAVTVYFTRVCRNAQTH